MNEVMAAPVSDGMTAGALLRRAREASGLHVAALAVSLKVPVRKLEALEEDRYDLMPDAVFIRGLASSVCRTLKIDPQPVLDRLPQTAAPRLVSNADGLNQPFRAPSDGAAPSWVDQLRQPVFLFVFAVLLGALVLIFLPAAHKEDKPAPAGAPAAVPAPAGPVAESTLPAEPPAASQQAPVAVPAKEEPLAVAPAVQSVASAAGAPAAAASSVAATGTTGIVVIRAREDCWVEVTDAKGAVAVRKILAPGETAGASGALPLHVTVGRADATEVQVRGKPYDMRPVSHDNVARFDVK
jgi:cytoskeleton protein RodZ